MDTSSGFLQQSHRNIDIPQGAPSLRGPFSIMTALFFIWGFMTVWNDILIPRFKEVFSLSYFQAMLVQFAFFGAYAIGSLFYYILSIIWGDPINKIGYKNGVVFGLVIAAFGSAMFYPAAAITSYPLFLVALFTLGLGFAVLQIAANPYVTILGPEQTASSRLNLSQAFNSLGTTIGPIIGGRLIFMVYAKSGAHGTDSVKLPYLCFAATLLLVAIFFSIVKLPNFKSSGTVGHGLDVLKHPHTMLGTIAIFLYVGGEIGVGSAIINFLGLPSVGAYSHEVSSRYLAFYWGGLMIGRFMGAFALSEVRKWIKTAALIGLPILAFLSIAAMAGWNSALHYGVFLAIAAAAFMVGGSSPPRMLALFSGLIVLLLLTATLASGPTAQWSVLGIGLFCSVLWSNIFSLAIEGLGQLKSQASSLLVMAIAGGAVLPPIQGLIADRIGIQASFIVPMIAFAYVAFYGIYGYRMGRANLCGAFTDPAANAHMAPTNIAEENS